MSDLNNYKNELFNILSQETKDLLKIPQDEAFLRELAADIATQQWNLKTAMSEDKKEEYQKNIDHLSTQLQGRIQSRKNDLIEGGEIALKKVVGAVLKMCLTSLFRNFKLG